MGCEQSTPVGDGPPKPRRTKGIGATERMIGNQIKKAGVIVIPSSDPKIDAAGQMLKEEVVKRTKSSATVSEVMLGNYQKGNVLNVRYAYWTQRGYYPDDPRKANQDEYSVTTDFSGEKGDALFAVYDGHGADGHDAAAFCKKKLPAAVAKHVRQKRVKEYQKHLTEEGKSTKGSFDPALWPKLGIQDYEMACLKGFLECNKAMFDDPKTNCKLSGTTAVSVAFHMGRITVCNVGDSRAILGHRIEALQTPTEEEKREERSVGNGSLAGAGTGTVIAVPLTKDQTPYRADERERIKKAGGVIMTIDQLEGTEPMHENWAGLDEDAVDISGDPPRVWEKGKNYPGTAFTRSIGDHVADNCGVIAEPEMLTTDLTSNDEYMIIASDGVFEFLPNQRVIDLCVESKDPLEACDKIIRESYDQWLKYENRTDDITCLVLFLNCHNEATKNSQVGTTEALVGKEAESDFKPLRLMTRTNDLGRSMANLSYSAEDLM